jgi:hypothetical protein
MTEKPNWLGLPNLRYQLATPFVIGQWCLPADTVVDLSLEKWVWLGNVPPPPDAVALTQQTYDFMTSNGQVGLSYPYWIVRPGPGVTPIHP